MFVKLEISLLLPKLLTGRLFSKYVCFFFSRCRCSQMFYKKPVVSPTTLVKHGYQHSCFLMNVVKIFKIAFSKNASWRLLLIFEGIVAFTRKVLQILFRFCSMLIVKSITARANGILLIYSWRIIHRLYYSYSKPFACVYFAFLFLFLFFRLLFFY